MDLELSVRVGLVPNGLAEPATRLPESIDAENGVRHRLAADLDRTDETAWHGQSGIDIEFLPLAILNRESGEWIGGLRGPHSHAPGHPANLVYHGVISIIKDRKTGLLWMGFENDGLGVFDSVTEKIVRHYTFDPEDSRSLSNDTVEDIFQDDAGVLWFATGRGLDRFEPETNR